APGLLRLAAAAAVLAGWSWGALGLVDVPIHEADLVGEDGAGLAVFDDHFADYRPLVAITALGGAASVHAAVAATLRARSALGILPRVRDTALVTLGRTHAELNAALVAAIVAVQLGGRDPSTGRLWARTMKAHGVDAACRASTELPLLVGAAAFRAGSHMTKVRSDLAGMLYADGVH